MQHPSPDLKKTKQPFFAAAIECKLADDKVNAGLISGYGSIFGNQDHHGDVVEKGAFTQSLRAHLTEKTNPLMLWQQQTLSAIRS